MLENEEKDSELLELLGNIIKGGKYYTLYNGKRVKFLCLKYRTIEANKILKEPYNKKDLKTVVKHIKQFLSK